VHAEAALIGRFFVRRLTATPQSVFQLVEHFVIGPRKESSRSECNRRLFLARHAEQDFARVAFAYRLAEADALAKCSEEGRDPLFHSIKLRLFVLG
jgi:hypothetical protein